MIPPELFNEILFHVGYQYRHKLWHDTITLGKTGIRRMYKGIVTCSFVCRHWANQCRRHLFSGARLLISSSDEAETFIKYAAGCPTLVPVHTLIEGIEVVQRYRTRSFCHRLHIFKSKPYLEFFALRLVGTVPHDLPPQSESKMSGCLRLCMLGNTSDTLGAFPPT
ncbi:hypothetical protein BDY19DRAFT_943826 [Irpex rosettiformis]|uniref:Uncharacterized protein n=1 Tax=Irpex rosettiformis TaxID=378272 RepID=A0ACB8U631_9APHY|nr:hypothetical protein BDY19DRAFT_943826 [Irpex rosettiformis]